jgi:hypothetical protein
MREGRAGISPSYDRLTRQGDGDLRLGRQPDRRSAGRWAGDGRSGPSAFILIDNAVRGEEIERLQSFNPRCRPAVTL